MPLVSALIFVTTTYAAAPKFEQIARLTPPFEENRGQAAPDIRFLARDTRGTLEITATGARAILAKRDRKGNAQTAIVPFEFPGADWSRVEGESLLAGTTNVLSGNDSSKWRTGLRNYSAVRVHNAYPGIDIVFHSKRGSVEFDFELRPGADPARARIHFPSHIAKLQADGSVAVDTPAGALVLPKPIAFQSADQIVPSQFKIRNPHTVAIIVARYDRSKPLTIDPAVAYFTFNGGTSTEAATGFAIDAAGNFYLAGSTASTNFPVSATPFQKESGGNIDAFVTKYSASGALVYSTLLGGRDREYINKIAVDSQGSIYFCGASASANFPLAGAIQPTNKGGSTGLDAVFGKLNPAGSALVYSTYYGGNFTDRANGCVVDSEGNLYVTGYTVSDNFPFTPGSFQTSNRSPFAGNGFVAKIAPAGDRAIFSTYLGGGVDDELYDIAIDRNRNIYVVGESISIQPAYPTAGALQPTNRGNIDAVVTKMNAAGTALTWSTFLGGDQRDTAYAVAVDASDNVHVVGKTASSNFPLANALQRELSGPNDGFVVKLDAAGTSMIYGTLFGGNRNEDPFGAAVDRAGALYVVGTTDSQGIAPVDAAQPIPGGSADAFLVKYNPQGSQIQMMTYIGEIGADLGFGVALDNSGRIFVAGTSSSSALTPTSNATQKGFGGATDGFVAIIDGSPGANPFTVSSTRLTFTGAPGATIAAQQFNIRATAGTPEWTIDAATLTGGNWLSATPRTGSGNATIDVRVNTTGVTTGTHEGTLTVNNTRLGTRTVVAVILTLGEAGGEVPNNGVVSAATFTGGGVSPGLLVTIFGSRIGPSALTTAQVTPQGTLATTIAETRVLFDGVAAPIVYASAGQVSAIVPYDVNGRTTTAMQVEYRGTRSNAVNLRVTDTAPGLFTANSSGKGQGAILNEDSSFNSASNPAKPGSIIVLYGTGEGATDPTGTNGLLANSVFPKPRQPVTVRIGGKNAEVLYAGAAPGLVAGVFQVNVRIPADVEAGAQPVIVQVGANSSPADVTVAVQP